MCTPLAGVSIGASAASSALSAYGSIMQGNAANKAAQYNSQVTLMDAQSNQDAARINEQQTYREGDQLEGRARAAMGANGVMTNSGSALQVQKDIGTRTGQNVADQSYNAQTATWGALNQSQLDLTQGKFAQQAGYLSAAGSLLSGASQVAGKWQSFYGTPPQQGGTPSAPSSGASGS